MKKLVAKLFVFSVTTLLLLASVAASSACTVSHYQPEVPASLRK
jgi:cyclic lactone autoinducer peptide